MSYKTGSKFIWEYSPTIDHIISPHRVVVELVEVPEKAKWKHQTKSLHPDGHTALWSWLLL